MRTGRKVQAIFAFAFQLPPCAFAIIRLVYLHRSLGAQDHTWENVDTHIWTQINVHFNVIAANIPCLRMFLEGALMVSEAAGFGGLLTRNTIGFQSVLFKNNLTTRLGPSSTFVSEPKSSRRKQSRSGRRTDPESMHIHDGASMSGIAAASGPKGSYETVNRSNNESDNQNGIYRTVEWTVLEDNNQTRDPYKQI